MFCFKKALVIVGLIIISVHCGAQNTSTATVSKEKCEKNCISFEDHFRFLNFFETTNQYLTFLRNLKFISNTDFIEMTSELEKMQLLNSPISEWPRFKNSVISLNKVKLSTLSDSEFLKSPSVRLKVNSRETFKENYLNFNRELTSEKQFSWFNAVFINSAWGAPLGEKDKKDAALVSLATVSASLYSGLEIVGACVPGVLISGIGQVSQVIKSIIYPFRRFIYKGKVECLRGEYVLQQPQFIYFDSVAKYKEHYEWYTRYDKDLLEKAYGVCHGLINSGDKTVADALAQYNCEKPECIKPIPMSEVSQILNKSPSETPKCNPETALIIQNFKKKQAEKDESTILGRLFSVRSAVAKTGTNKIPDPAARTLSGN